LVSVNLWSKGQGNGDISLLWVVRAPGELHLRYICLPEKPFMFGCKLLIQLKYKTWKIMSNCNTANAGTLLPGASAAGSASRDARNVQHKVLSVICSFYAMKLDCCQDFLLFHKQTTSTWF